MSCYRIVNILLESDPLPPRFDPFLVPDENEKDGQKIIRICYRPGKELTDPFAAASEVSGLRIGRSEKGWVFEDCFSAVRMQVNEDYSRAELSEEVKRNHIIWCFLLQLLIEGRLLDEGVLTLHSSCVELEGKAYAFSGPSGCGKSTRARRWAECFGADFISGDRPAVQVKEKIAFGIPWDGKEQIFRNKRAPVGAIFEVRRSTFTRLRKLSAKQARNVLIEQIYVPMWDSERAMEAMILLNKLAGSFPVCRLFCNQDEKAAIETKRILWEQPERIREESSDMKLKEGFVLKSMAGEYVLMPTGENIARFNGSVLLNELSAFIIKKLEAGPVGKEDMADLILAEYEVSRETVLKDLDELAQQLSDMGVISLD